MFSNLDKNYLSNKDYKDKNKRDEFRKFTRLSVGRFS